MKQRFLFTCILLVAVIIACNKDSDSSIPETSSNINVFLAVPGVQYDVVVDTTTIGSSLEAGQSTGYHSFIAKRYNLFIYPAGDHTTAIAGGQISLRNNHYYSVFLSLDHTNALRLLAVEDKLDLPAANTGKVRVIDLSDTYNSDAQTVNLDFYANDTLRFQRISYLAVTNFIQLQAGTYTRDIFYADSSLSLLGNNLPSFTIADRKIYSWIVYGNAQVADSFKLVEFVHN
ncbi:DUF4397 domain-containing protein [Chitinophaga sp. CF118]|uniref:DUF4397 domain-containing protein n=1 Tax=Chitinophaga sp. CF118 TaxID=1884367 RepID=UPI0015A51579|nr:DUF4397 domain-containing protein [Chitinophaga sp. CF118]